MSQGSSTAMESAWGGGVARSANKQYAEFCHFCSLSGTGSIFFSACLCPFHSLRLCCFSMGTIQLETCLFYSDSRAHILFLFVFCVCDVCANWISVKQRGAHLMTDVQRTTLPIKSRAWIVHRIE
ncbi:hypothetical protein BC940DRAFT_303090 [Gongronella butleri]|nr:hypothetical protein BC940DRAFT_303090 [Gongronella butleri]